MKDASTAPGPGPYQLFMLGLCIYVLLALGATTLFEFSEDTRTVIDYLDAGICTLFFLDFCVSFARAPNRSRYFATWGWIDLVSSIPMLPVLRVGRAGRILRIFRLLRGFRSTKILSEFILMRRAEGVFLAAALLSILLIAFASIAILLVETVPEANIKSAEDAMWWAYVTITTVGYGDRYPVTTEGRLIGAGLMTAGVGLFGTFTGFVASWFLSPQQKEQESELQILHQELRVIKERLDDLARRDARA
jgi:voltage-gated potassium channel